MTGPDASMYAHCVHCQAALGRNDVLEAFPVGRRVAFDEAQGRLWVVCTKCERWNLAPFDTRWEAIEQAERAYRGTTVRIATDNIGLAKWRDGTTLVRIGRPLRPEFAAWRYGDQFGRRRRRAWLMGGAAAIGAGAVVTGAVATGAGLVALAPLMHVTTLLAAVSNSARVHGRPLQHPDGDWFIPVGNPRLVPGAGPDGWAIEVGWNRRLDAPDTTWRDWLRPGPNGNNGENGRVTLHGALARDVLARLLPSVNGAGATTSRVQEAVTLLDDVGGPERVMSWAVTQRRAWGAKQTFGDTGDLGFIPRPARLAIEMAVHEERERLALLGELAELERAWLEAERIARIADKLLVPDDVSQRLAELRGRVSSAHGP